MRKFTIILILVGLCMAFDVSTQAVPLDRDKTSTTPTIQKAPVVQGRGLIGPAGDTRTILGVAGKNIVTVPDGAAIAVMYGPPSDPYDPTQAHEGVYAAYSTDQGGSWATFGPFSAVSPLRRIYPGVDGCEAFDSQSGNLHFAWQEAQAAYPFSNIYTMIEENVPSSPSFSSPILMTPDISPWMPCPAVNPDDNNHIMVTAWSYIPNGNSNNYGWISTDGGYTWSDTILVAAYVDEAFMNAGHLRWGSDGYGFFAYHDGLAGFEHPYFVETTDYGYTWSSPFALPAVTTIYHWWHEFDCEVVQNEGNDFPVTVHNDIDAGGAGLMSLIFPDPDTPGGPGTWDWTAMSVDGVFTGAHVYQGTTWTAQVIQYPSVSFYDIGSYGLILVSYKANYVITPPSAEWPDGNYLGGIVSIDGGRTWRPTRPMSGPLLAAVGGATEVAHQLVVIPGRQEEYWAYTTWTDADDGVAGNQYFELGQVLPIDMDNWVPGIEEYGDGEVVIGFGLAVAPTIASGSDCQISFNITTPGQVSLKVFDATGRLVETPFDGYLGAGSQSIDLNTSRLPNGVYIVSLTNNAETETAKFITMR